MPSPPSASRASPPRCSRWSIATSYTSTTAQSSGCCGLASLTVGAHPSAGTFATFAIIAVAGFGIHALQTGLYLVSAHVFPIECRTSGIGFASGAGRLGGIASSLAGGYLLEDGGAAGFFGAVALVLTLAVVSILTLRRHI